MKLIFKVIALLQIFCFLVACTQTTTGVWEKPEYRESINQFLATEDGEKLVFVGKKYHYIFSDTSSLFDILTWQNRRLLIGRFDKSFRVDSSNNIEGSYTIDCLCENADVNQIRWLKTKGFVEYNKHQESNGEVTYRKEGYIRGVRYLSRDIEFNNTTNLNNEYDIFVETEHTTPGVIGRIALTPIAIAEDGAATIGLVALVAVGIPFDVLELLPEEVRKPVSEGIAQGLLDWLRN